MRGICRFRWQSFPLRILIPRVVRITSSQPQGVLGLGVMCRASVSVAGFPDLMFLSDSGLVDYRPTRSP